MIDHHAAKIEDTAWAGVLSERTRIVANAITESIDAE